MRGVRKGWLVAGLVLVGLLVLVIGTQARSVDYGDVNLAGGFQAGHFGEIWDLTKGDMYIIVTVDLTGMVDDFGGAAHAWSELGIRQVGYGDFNPTWMAEGAGVWLATDYDWTANTFDPDPLGAPILDLDDKLILQKGGGQGEGSYNLPSSPPNPWANHAFWFDRDGVDPWQALMWGAVDGVTYNTGGIYNLVIRLHADSATSGTAYMTINSADQGFYVPNWHSGAADLMPAGMTFTGDMTQMQVFYGIYGYGATHTVQFGDLVAILTDVVWVDDDWVGSSTGDKVDGHYYGYDAFATVQDGVDNVGSSTVNVASGIYYENVDINNAMKVYGADGAVLDGTGLGGTGINVDSGHVTLDNLEVRNFSDGILVYVGSDYGTDWTGVLLSNNTVHGMIGGGGGASGFGLYIGTESERFWLPTPPWGMAPLTHLLDFTGLEVRGNEIYDTVMAALVLQSITSLAEPLLVVGNNVHDSENDALWIDSSSNILVQGNDFIDSATGIFISAYSDGWYEGIANQPFDTQDVRILYNNITGNSPYGGVAIYDGWPATIVAHFNVITGNSIGVFNWVGGGDVDAALNWWGDTSGPSGVGTGSGDAVSSNVIFSPWLGMNLDGDPTTVGVQVTGPVLIIVAPVGPEPASGYLNAAIAGANELPYADTIEVRSGMYADDAIITDPVTIGSQEGCPSTTFIGGNLVLGSEGIQLGSLRHGFTISGDLTVGAGINAAQIHVNWNNIEGQVTNTAGIGSLDATYNFWGADGPLDNIVGQVHYYPYLPIEVCAVIQYMDDYGLNPNQAIVMAKKVLKHVNPKDILVAFGLVNVCGMSMDDALALVREHGRVRVQRALRLAHGDCAEFYTQLVGYGVGGGAGGGLLDKQIAGGGGAIEGVALEASYTQGDTIHVAFTLTDPITGDVVTEAVATLSVVRVTPGEIREFIYWGIIPYDSVSGQYQLDYDTSGLIPGYYDLYIGTSDGQTKQLRVEIVAP